VIFNHLRNALPANDDTPYLISQWHAKNLNQTCQQRFVLFAIAHLLGVKNGLIVGMKLNIVPIDVVAENLKQ